MQWTMLLAAFAAAAADQWPQFRGPAAAGTAPGAPPVTWNGEQGGNILWKTEIPGLGHSSPIVWDNLIFVTSAVAGGDREAVLKTGLYGNIQPVEDEGAQSYNLYAIDRRTGKILWQRTAVRTQPKIKRHPKSTHANPTPVTDGQRVIAFFGSEGLYAYDRKGTLLWKKDFGVLDSGYFEVPAAQWGFASSPVLHDGKLILQVDVQKDSFLAAYDAATGRQIWRTPRGDVPTWSTPSIVPYSGDPAVRQQIVTNGWKEIAGYDLNTGRQLWTMSGGGDIPVPTPVYSGEYILITNAHGPGRPIYAIRTDAKGTITGKPEAIAWSQDRAGNYMQTPLVHEGIGYFCMDTGVLTAFDAKTGERIYQERLGAGNTGFSGSGVAANGRLYLTSEDGTTFVLKLGRKYSLESQNELGESVMSTPAIAGDTLYIRGRRHLYAIGARR